MPESTSNAPAWLPRPLRRSYCPRPCVLQGPPLFLPKCSPGAKTVQSRHPTRDPVSIPLVFLIQISHQGPCHLFPPLSSPVGLPFQKETHRDATPGPPVLNYYRRALGRVSRTSSHSSRPHVQSTRQLVDCAISQECMSSRSKEFSNDDSASSEFPSRQPVLFLSLAARARREASRACFCVASFHSVSSLVSLPR